VYFGRDGRVSTSGGPWEREVLQKDPPIAELETLAHLYGLRRHHLSAQTPIHSVLDNTTALYNIAKGRAKNFHINSLLQHFTEYNIRSLQYISTVEMQKFAGGISRGKPFDPAGLIRSKFRKTPSMPTTSWLLLRTRRNGNQF